MVSFSKPWRAMACNFLDMLLGEEKEMVCGIGDGLQ